MTVARRLLFHHGRRGGNLAILPSDCRCVCAVGAFQIHQKWPRSRCESVDEKLKLRDGNVQRPSQRLIQPNTFQQSDRGIIRCCAVLFLAGSDEIRWGAGPCDITRLAPALCTCLTLCMWFVCVSPTSQPLKSADHIPRYTMMAVIALLCFVIDKDYLFAISYIATTQRFGTLILRFHTAIYLRIRLGCDHVAV